MAETLSPANQDSQTHTLGVQDLGGGGSSGSGSGAGSGGYMPVAEVAVAAALMVVGGGGDSSKGDSSGGGSRACFCLLGICAPHLSRILQH